MNADAEKATSIRHYYVDEAGDGTLFNSKGKVLIGEEGCSRYFSVGLLVAMEPERLESELTDLRLQLLRDPYFKDIPSMQPERKKTALAFHAKDDIPEVRREVFRLLDAHNVSFFAVVRDKRHVLDYVRQKNDRDNGYRYHPNELYDSTVKRLFKDRLHKDDHYRVTFATRGHSDRTSAFGESLLEARSRFEAKWGIEAQSEIEVVASNPRVAAPLQAVDYFLWALQRLYERGEDRYWNYVAPKASLVQDVDDLREASYGRYYTKKKPLTLAALER